MNREIKFRAWDKKENKMITHGCIGAGSGAQLIVIEFQGGITLANAFGLPDGTNPTFDDPVTDRLELMQFTGLKDKNGVEIYEGDIIHAKTNYHTRDKEFGWQNLKVYWDKDYLSWYLENKEGSQYHIIEETDEASYLWEVIGNIYQNTELLK